MLPYGAATGPISPQMVPGKSPPFLTGIDNSEDYNANDLINNSATVRNRIVSPNGAMGMKNKMNFVELQQNYRIASMSNHPQKKTAQNFLLSKSPSGASLKSFTDIPNHSKTTTKVKISPNASPATLNRNVQSHGFLPDM